MNKKIVFMGTPDYATIIFKELLANNYEILALFTQPDKKVGRKQILTPPHIKQYSLENNLSIPIFQPSTLKDEEVKKSIEDLEPDFIVVAAYGQILPQNILDIAPCINLHASLLPLYRGASPIQQSILNDDSFSGVTAMMMEAGLDSGDIIGLKYLKLEDEMCVDEAFNKLSDIAAKLTIEVLERYETIEPKEQILNQVSHCGKIIKDDGLVDFSDAKNLYQQYKAYKFWPGIFLESGLKIKECSLLEENSSNNEGSILSIEDDHIILGCLKGSLKIYQVQAPSKKAISIVDYIRGSRLQIGDIIQ
jgi:methionyl-tRNA formyltransferase